MSRERSRVPDLLQCYLKYREVIQAWRGTGDISIDLPFLQPTTLLPLWAEAEHNHVQLVALNSEVREYIDALTKGACIPAGGTYLPPVRLPRTHSEAGAVTRQLSDLSRQTRIFQANPNVFDYVLSELIDNIYQHAHAEVAFALAQYYPRKKEIEIGFLDNGVTIPGSLERGTELRFPPELHYQAVLNAMDGSSSKGGTERGYGLGTSLELMTQLEGSGLIVSGQGAIFLSGDQRQPFALSKEERMPGTLISIQLPDGDKKINLYDVVGR